MQRRKFLAAGLSIPGARLVERAASGLPHSGDASSVFFSTADGRWQAAYDKALSILAANVQILPHYDSPVLLEGAEYAGIWQECGPMEALIYRPVRPDVARNSHEIFFALQRRDGQIPANDKRDEAGYGQIQMVVPIAATAWELAHATGDAELLQDAYDSCSRWDAWLRRYRDTRRSGLVEGFCTYDTGMDNSPRWAGMPVQCPNKDARLCPPVPTLPRLCPDLSAAVYGARVALAAMAAALGNSSGADHWQEQADVLRKLIIDRLYVDEDAAFYDVDAENHRVRTRSVVLARVCGEHVVDQAMFDALWQKQLGNPEAFWAPYPLPSVALDDPTFVRPIPPNSWGGASQALTALRAGRWMDHYGRGAEFGRMMEQWCEALQRAMSFRQQLDPLTGEFTQGDSPNYSPAALAMFDFTWRLAGVREQGESLHWNVLPGEPVSHAAVFRIGVRSGSAAMRYAEDSATLTLAGRIIAEVGGAARLVTDRRGKPLSLVGTRMTPQAVDLRIPGRPVRRVTLNPNQKMDVSAA